MISADRDRVAAPVVRAVDQHTAHAHVAHLGEGDFGGLVHSVIPLPQSNPEGEQKRRDDTDEHPRVAGPVGLHFGFAFQPDLDQAADGLR
jgi:hypothetical protein